MLEPEDSSPASQGSGGTYPGLLSTHMAEEGLGSGTLHLTALPLEREGGDVGESSPPTVAFRVGQPRPGNREDRACGLDSLHSDEGRVWPPQGLTTALATVGCWRSEDGSTPGWSDTRDVSHLKAEVKWGTLPLARQEASPTTPSPPPPAGAWLPPLGSETGG